MFKNDPQNEIDFGLLVAVVNQIELDVEEKDYTAIEALFQFLDKPEERLRGFLRTDLRTGEDV